MDFGNINIETERILVRLLVAGDVSDLYAMFSDPETMQYWSTPAHTNSEEVKRQISRSQSLYNKGESLDLGVVLKKNNTLIGKLAVYNVNEDSMRAEIGYILARNYWRQGIMREVFPVFVDYCFDTLKLRRLEADIDPDNIASARLLTRTGFLREGLLKERWLIGDKPADSEVYGLLNPDR